MRNPQGVVLGRPGPTRSGERARSVLFLRDFQAFTGGHLKMWHYFGHVDAHPNFEPVVQFTDRSVWDASNPWSACRDRVVGQQVRVRADVLFVGGLDWSMLRERQRHHRARPVVNLIQHVRHADPSSPRYQFLSLRAVRVCVSPEITEALVSTGICNGPVVTIPNAIDLQSLPDPMAPDVRPFDLFIAGKKAPAMARKLAGRLARPQRRIRLSDGLLGHTEFLDAINQARVTLFLPNPTEGFYLPALEGMALGTLVVCPDVVGNRSFCAAGVNCLFPDFEEDALVEATEAALAASSAEQSSVLAAASATAAEHDLGRERAAFHGVLDHLDDLYSHG